MNLVTLQDTKLIPMNYMHSFILTTKGQKEIVRKNPIYHCNKMKKVPRKNLPKEVKDMCSEADKTLMKEIKMTQTGGDIYHALRLEESIL